MHLQTNHWLDPHCLKPAWVALPNPIPSNPAKKHSIDASPQSSDCSRSMVLVMATVQSKRNLAPVMMIQPMTLVVQRQRHHPLLWARAFARCDLAPFRECQNNTHLGLARTDEANLEHPKAMTDNNNRTESLRPMTETTAFWGALGRPSFAGTPS